jgi:Flp pilus assembly protein TadG
MDPVSTHIRAHLTDEPGVRFGIANGLLVAALIAAASVRLNTTGTEIVAVIAAGIASVGLSILMTSSVGVIAWALFTGFIENSYGQLTFEKGDLIRMAVFAAATITLAVVTRNAYRVVEENAHGRRALGRRILTKTAN